MEFLPNLSRLFESICNKSTICNCSINEGATSGLCSPWSGMSGNKPRLRGRSEDKKAANRRRALQDRTGTEGKLPRHDDGTRQRIPSKGNSTPRRGNGSSIPFLRATPAETHPGCRKVNKKFRERDIPTAPLPAGGISPPDSHNLNLSAIPAYTARAPRFRGWRPFALLYPTILPRCRFEIRNHPFSFRNSVERSILRTLAALLTDPSCWIVSRIILFSISFIRLFKS